MHSSTTRAPTICLALLVTASASGCFTVNAALPGTLRGDIQPASDTETLSTVEVKKTNTFLLWGLLSPPPADFFEKDLREQVQKGGGDGIANLTYESEFSPPNILLGCVTLGILAPRDYRVSGDVVRIKKGPVGRASAAPAGAAPAAATTDPAQPPPPPIMQGY